MPDNPSKTPIRLGVMISGGGSTLANFCERIRTAELRGVEIAQVVSSRRAVRGVEIARRENLPLKVLRPRDFESEPAFWEALTTTMDDARVDLVALAGFLCFWQIPPHYEHRVLNIHPALLPKYGGKGMFGLNVHAAVLAAGETESGCTVHVVDNEYDHGPIVAQRRVAVAKTDSPESLAARVGVAERELYPEVIQQVADHGVGWLRRFQDPQGRPA
jgi:phosphoribosylglycinamide formyltransferase-1